jgi:hypothetical protein
MMSVIWVLCVWVHQAWVCRAQVCQVCKWMCWVHEWMCRVGEWVVVVICQHHFVSVLGCVRCDWEGRTDLASVLKASLVLFFISKQGNWQPQPV